MNAQGPSKERPGWSADFLPAVSARESGLFVSADGGLSQRRTIGSSTDPDGEVHIFMRHAGGDNRLDFAVYRYVSADKRRLDAFQVSLQLAMSGSVEGVVTEEPEKGVLRFTYDQTTPTNYSVTEYGLDTDNDRYARLKRAFMMQLADDSGVPKPVDIPVAGPDSQSRFQASGLPKVVDLQRTLIAWVTDEDLTTGAFVKAKLLSPDRKKANTPSQSDPMKPSGYEFII